MSTGLFPGQRRFETAAPCRTTSLNSWLMLSVFVGLIIVVVIISIPATHLDWSAIDDMVHAIQVPPRMAAAVREHRLIGTRADPGLLIVEPTSGRLRPVAWLVYLLAYRIAGTDLRLLHLLRFLWLAIAACASAVTAWFLVRSAVAAAFAGILVVSFGGGLINFYRLAPVEAPLIAWVCLTFACLAWAWRQISLGKSIAIPMSLVTICAVLAYGTKETAIVMLPFAWVLYVSCYLLEPEPGHLRGRRVALAFAVLVTILSLGIVGWFLGSGSFGRGYGRYLGQGGLFVWARNLIWYSWSVLSAYGILLIVASVTFLWRLKHNWLATRRLHPIAYWQLAFLAWFAGGLVLQSVWRTADVRYLTPFTTGVALFIGLELARLLASFRYCERRVSIFLGFVLLLGAGLFLWENAADAVNDYLILRWRDASNFEAVTYLAGAVPANGRVWLNLPADDEIDGEYRHGFYYLLRELYARPDIETPPLSGQHLTTCCRGDFVALWTYVAAVDPARAAVALANRSELVWQNSYTVQRLWSPGAWLEHLLLTGPLNRPNRAPLDTYIYAWQILRVKP